MGSLEEEELIQMVHEFIESESAYPSTATSSNCHAFNHPTQYLILQDILRSETAAETRVRKFAMQNLNRYKGKRRETDKTTAMMRKWLTLQLKVSGLDASLCQTSWASSMGCPSGDYEYIDLKVEDEGGNPIRLIVDIDFRSQFELARPTETYKQLTDTLPVVFFGSEGKLYRMINLLCSAAKQSLRERGFHVPPWRTTAYMQSKWLSSCHRITVEAVNAGFSGESFMEVKDCVHGFGEWVPPKVKPKRRGIDGESRLSSQLSDMSINCC